jgi:hypothetical protein
MVSATSSGMTTIDHDLSVPKRHKNASSYKADVLSTISCHVLQDAHSLQLHQDLG